MTQNNPEIMAVLKPGDRVVLQHQKVLVTDQEAALLREQWSKHFPDVAVMVVGKDWLIPAVLRADDVDAHEAEPVDVDSRDNLAYQVGVAARCGDPQLDALVERARAQQDKLERTMADVQVQRAR